MDASSRGLRSGGGGRQAGRWRFTIQGTTSCFIELSVRRSIRHTPRRCCRLCAVCSTPPREPPLPLPQPLAQPQPQPCPQARMIPLAFPRAALPTHQHRMHLPGPATGHGNVPDRNQAEEGFCFLETCGNGNRHPYLFHGELNGAGRGLCPQIVHPRFQALTPPVEVHGRQLGSSRPCAMATKGSAFHEGHWGR